MVKPALQKTLEETCQCLDQLAISLDFVAGGVAEHNPGARWILIQQSNLACRVEETIRGLLETLPEEA